MKRILFLTLLALPAAFAIDPEAKNVKTVYLLRMTSGLDQYLASELTQNGVYAVTTDAARADALFTDSLGDSFEAKYAALYPPPAPPKDDKKKSDEKKEEATIESGATRPSSTWGRGKGTVFLVDRKSRNVLWSMQRQAKDSSLASTVDLAKKIAIQLMKDLGMTPTGAK